MIELGIAGGLAWWPYIGSLTRYSRSTRATITPVVLGLGVLMSFVLLVGLFFFGWDKLSKLGHLTATWAVAIGSNFSALRGEGEKLSGGGRSSGLMSFLKIGDRAAGAIKSGGTTRRAAKMVVVDVDHPDIEEYIAWKVKEEQKVAALVTGFAQAIVPEEIKVDVPSADGGTQKVTMKVDFSSMFKNLGKKIAVVVGRGSDSFRVIRRESGTVAFTGRLAAPLASAEAQAAPLTVLPRADRDVGGRLRRLVPVRRPGRSGRR